jgi:hypothetical protein
MSDKKIDIIEKRDPGSVANLAASSGKPPSSSSAGNFIKAEEISFSKSGQWALNKYGDAMTVSGSGSMSPDGGVLAQSEPAQPASNAAITMYHIHDGAHRITKDPMHIEAINTRFGSTQNLESKGFRLIPATPKMTKEEMEKQGTMNAPATRVPPTVSGTGGGSINKSVTSDLETLEKSMIFSPRKDQVRGGPSSIKAHKDAQSPPDRRVAPLTAAKINEHIDSGDEKKGIVLIQHHFQRLTPEHHEKLANHPNATVKAAYKQKKDSE